MTSVTFLNCNGEIKGFHIKGHATKNADDVLGKQVCSAVSSACYLVCNTVTEVLKLKCDITVKDGEMKFLLAKSNKEAVDLLKGFKIHILELKEQYNNLITTETEDILNVKD